MNAHTLPVLAFFHMFMFKRFRELREERVIFPIQITRGHWRPT
jgi:hypothetical protein